MNLFDWLRKLLYKFVLKNKLPKSKFCEKEKLKNLIAAFDVHYQNDSAAACVTFQNWTDSASVAEYVFEVSPIEPYQSGSFYKRELPCLAALIEHYSLQPEIIVVDGYVWLDENKIGLDGHLYKYLGGRIPIVGAAKTRFRGHSKVREVLRGDSNNPLYVSAIGLELNKAAENIKQMHGEFRVPTLLKKVDRLCRRLEPITQITQND